MSQNGQQGSDRDVLSQPSVELVMCLLEPCLPLAPHRNLVTRLAAALAVCAQLNSLGKYVFISAVFLIYNFVSSYCQNICFVIQWIMY